MSKSNYMVIGHKTAVRLSISSRTMLEFVNRYFGIKWVLEACYPFGQPTLRLTNSCLSIAEIDVYLFLYVNLVLIFHNTFVRGEIRKIGFRLTSDMITFLSWSAITLSSALHGGFRQILRPHA